MTKDFVFNPHASPTISFSGLIKSLIKNRNTIFQLGKREISAKYRGSIFGLAWSFINPLIMLTIYTIVFSEIFKTRWPGAAAESAGKAQFALILFIGLILLNFFNEVVNRAPNLIVANVNYVKKVVFPVEILSVVSVFAAIFHALISFCVLIIAIFAINGFLNWTVLFLPLVVLPLLILVLGLAWILASLGVYIRDVSQTISLLTTLLTFLSPVFYPLSAVPVKLRVFVLANPLTFIIEQARSILIFGEFPNWIGLSIYLLTSIAICWFGFIWFQKTRSGFADVL